jgi:hypothetical protein
VKKEDSSPPRTRPSPHRDNVWFCRIKEEMLEKKKSTTAPLQSMLDE